MPATPRTAAPGLALGPPAPPVALSGKRGIAEGESWPQVRRPRAPAARATVTRPYTVGAAHRASARCPPGFAGPRRSLRTPSRSGTRASTRRPLLRHDPAPLTWLTVLRRSASRLSAAGESVPGQRRGLTAAGPTPRASRANGALASLATGRGSAPHAAPARGGRARACRPRLLATSKQGQVPTLSAPAAGADGRGLGPPGRRFSVFLRPQAGCGRASPVPPLFLSP